MIVNGTCTQCGVAIRYEVHPKRNHPNRFCSLSCAAKHRFTGRGGPGHHLWKGGRSRDKDGYVILNGLGRKRPVQEHIYIAEQALGKPLPRGVVVHHVNEIKDDNRNQNLVICQDNAYHMFLHALMRVRAAGGIPFRDRWCFKCQRPRPRSAFYENAEASAQPCRDCCIEASRQRRREKAVEQERRTG